MWPLVGAIVAGNVAVIKPSELCPSTEMALKEFIPKYLDNSCFKVVCGDAKVASSLLELRWDFIFFTGSTRVAKIIAQAAAKHLTPHVFELGGKSPVYVDRSCTDLALAARRILWSKCVNAGQTCVAADYALIHSDIYDEFLEVIKRTLRDFYGKTAGCSASSSHNALIRRYP